MITQPVCCEIDPEPDFLELPGGRRLAYHLTGESLPGVVFMGGFRSDMTGAKAMAIQAFCREEGVRCLRFDYSGHGQSSGDFIRGTIGGWLQDAVDMLDYVAEGPNILVGSSMGAWIALLAALKRPQAVAGLVCIAAAPDFTERLIWQKLSPKQKKQLEEEGVIYLSACYGEAPYPITRALIEEGRRHLLLDMDIPLSIPVRLIHGTSDEDVPWRISAELMERLKTPDISLEMVRNGGHRLSDPSQLALMVRMVEEVVSSCA